MEETQEKAWHENQWKASIAKDSEKVDFRKEPTKIAQLYSLFVTLEKDYIETKTVLGGRVLLLEKKLAIKDEQLRALKVKDSAGNMVDLDTKIAAVEKELSELKQADPAAVAAADVEAIKQEVKTVLDKAKKATDVDTAGLKDRMESAWTEVAIKKHPGVLPMTAISREQMEQDRLSKENGSNVIIHSLKPKACML